MAKQRKRTSLQDVADHVDLTKMTVSRFLRNPETVAEKTRKKISQAIDELGYIHNKAPTLLSKSATRTLGVMLPSLSNQVFASFIGGVELIANKYGYEILIAHYSYDTQQEENKISTLLSYQVDGIILTGTTHSDRAIKMLRNANIPIVETMELAEEPLDMVVGLDHESAAYSAVSHLIKQGKKRIGFFGDRLDVRTKHRMQGYDRAILEHGLTKHHFLTPNHSSFTLGKELLKRAVFECKDLDGVFCNNDDIAVGVIIACQEHGIEVPNQVGVVGYNALDVGQAISPTLTSVYTPRYEMGEKSADILIADIEGRPYQEKIFDLGFAITQGKSCG